MLDGDVAARRVRDRLREELRRRQRGPFLDVLLHVVDGGLHGAERGADGDAAADRKLALAEGEPRRGDGEARELVHAPQLHRRDEVARPEVAHEGGGVRGEAGGVEAVDGGGGGRGDHAEAGDGDAHFRRIIARAHGSFASGHEAVRRAGIRP